MLAHFKERMARASTAAVSSPHATSYRWCYVEQVDPQEGTSARHKNNQSAANILLESSSLLDSTSNFALPLCSCVLDGR